MKSNASGVACLLNASKVPAADNAGWPEADAADQTNA